MCKGAMIIIGLVKMEMQDPLIKPGRPRLQADYALILRLRDEEHLGWSRGSERYREITGQWISRDTFKRRYYEAKAEKSPLERIVEEILQWKLEI